jgi:hypothetical protein
MVSGIANATFIVSSPSDHATVFDKTFFGDIELSHQHPGRGGEHGISE